VQRVSLCRALKRISRHEVDIVSIDGAETCHFYEQLEEMRVLVHAAR
jgi:hypothetical protein